LPVDVEVASEFRYREPAVAPGTLALAVSQSGETADTLAALRWCKAEGLPTAAIVNSHQSSMAREADLMWPTHAGPEIGVASTKAFTAQLTALLMLTLKISGAKGRKHPELEEALHELPAAMANVLRVEPEIAGWAAKFSSCEHALFLGRGVHYPIAMEGALKLKEISYIHAEAYAAGELKHGPLALVDARMPVIAIAPRDALLDKLKSNLQEVRARGGELYVLAHRDAGLTAGPGVHLIAMPDCPAVLSPIVSTVPLQLLAYRAALARGNDVDKPRNLAKSVTVE
jgi:glucosamine--fructose-6-phosphate aminotransferase (isomerizing)